MTCVLDFTEEHPQNRVTVMIITKDFGKLQNIIDGITRFYGIFFDDDECTKIVNELINNKNVTIKCNSFHIRIDLGDVELPKNHGMRRNIVFCDKELAYKDYENNEKYEEFEDSIEPIVTINGLNWISNYIPDVFII